MARLIVYTNNPDWSLLLAAPPMGNYLLGSLFVPSVGQE